MNVSRRIWISALMPSLAAVGVARAQVGHLPERSPFRDLEGRHELTLVAGDFQGARDKLGIAPTGGPLFGLQYEWRGVQALHLAVTASHIGGERTIIDPARPENDRYEQTQPWPLWAIDGMLATALTGAKSWNGLVPMVNLGIGLVSDVKGRDVGGYRFGTRFTFVVGTGLRWVPRPNGKLQLRADITDRMYTINYPDGYFVPTNGTPALRATSDAASTWLHNRALTIGVSYFGKR